MVKIIYPKVKSSLIIQKNPKGALSISDLEMVYLLLGCVDMYSDSTPTVAWMGEMDDKRSKSTVRLIRALALCQCAC